MPASEASLRHHWSLCAGPCWRHDDRGDARARAGSVPHYSHSSLAFSGVTVLRSKLEFVTDRASLGNSQVLHHQSHDVDQKVSRRDTGEICDSIIRSADFDDLSSHHYDAFQSADEASPLSG